MRAGSMSCWRVVLCACVVAPPALVCSARLAVRPPGQRAAAALNLFEMLALRAPRGVTWTARSMRCITISI